MAETKTLACKYSGCTNHQALTNTETGKDMISKVGELLGVEPFGSPNIVFFGPGYTITQIVGASHLALSTWPEDGEVSFTAEIYRDNRPYNAIRHLMRELGAKKCYVTETRSYKNGKSVLSRTLGT